MCFFTRSALLYYGIQECEQAPAMQLHAVCTNNCAANTHPDPGYKWWITQGTSGGSLRVQVVDHSGYKWWITQGTSGGSLRVQVVDHSFSGYAWPTGVMQSMFPFI